MDTATTTRLEQALTTSSRQAWGLALATREHDAANARAWREAAWQRLLRDAGRR